MNRVRVKVLDDSHYVIKRLYKLNCNIYNIEYSKSGTVYIIDENDLEKIEFFNIEVLSYKGPKGLILKIKRHRHFLLACLLSTALMFIISNFVVSIEVVHNDKKIRNIIYDELNKYNINTFTFKKSFKDLQEIKKKIKDDYPDNIEWLEIIENGMKYTVRVEERIITKEENEPEYCDIVSNKDAVILAIKSSKGQNSVIINDFVKKGSTLISGKIVFYEQIKSYTCAEGEILGNTWYTVNVSLPYDYSEKVYTGETKGNIGFEWGSSLTNIFRIHFDKYDIEHHKLISIGKSILYYETVKEYETFPKRYSEEEALEKDLEMGQEKLKLKLVSEVQILSQKVLQRNSYNSIISVDIFYSVKEKIGERVIKEKEEEEGELGENDTT